MAIQMVAVPLQHQNKRNVKPSRKAHKKKEKDMKKFILSLVAMSVIGTGTMSAQRNNHRDVRNSHRTEMHHHDNRRDVVVEKTVIVHEAPRPVAVRHHSRPVVVHESRRPVIIHEAPRPVVVERCSSPSVGAVVAGAVVGAVITSILTH